MHAPLPSTHRGAQTGLGLIHIVDQVKLFTVHIQSIVPYLEELHMEESPREASLHSWNCRKR